jgi:Holliday junction DNA helicase RuvA
VPGIGKKTAERLLLELKDKFSIEGLAVSANAPKSAAADILNALVSLGYNEKEALLAVKQLAPEIGVSEGIKLALKSLSK